MLIIILLGVLKTLMLKNLSFREIYWLFIENMEITQPWKTKWEQILGIMEIDWNKAWGNVHNNLLPYVVQSSLWMMTNLNYISAYKLNIMYGCTNICLQCQSPEEGPGHVFLYCEVSNRVYTYFDSLLRRIVNVDLTIVEKAFGLLSENVTLSKKENLRNYILACIKYTIFKNRAKESNSNATIRSTILISACKKFITSELRSNFTYAIEKKIFLLLKMIF